MSAAIVVLIAIVQAGIVFLLWTLYHWHKDSRVTPNSPGTRVVLGAIQQSYESEISLISMSWWIDPGVGKPSSAESMQRKVQRMQVELDSARRRGMTV